MALQAKKPTINLNFDDPSVKELAQFIQYLSENFKAEPNLPITIKVLECLMFIKLNFPWISYAILNKEKDNTIYKYSQDKAKRVLRAHNDMSFHIIMYKDPEKAISDYRDIITAIENGIDRLLANPAYTKTFIRKIQDSAIGCMEARLDLALNFIIDPSIPKLDDIFQDFFAEQTQLGIESEDIDKFIPHLTKYFAKKLDEEVTHDGKVIPLSWNEVKEYLEKFFGYDEELKPLNLLKDAIINTKDNNYILNFPSQSIAEKYLNLIQLSLPADLYLKLNKINIIKSEIIFNKLKNNNFFYNFQLTQEQFHILAILLDTSVNNLVSQSNIYSLISSLVTALNDDFEEVKSLINCHPALKNFMINKDGELLIHFLVQNNKLEQLKILVEAYQLDINAQIAITNSNRGGMTSVYLACLLDQVNNEILEYLLQAGADVNIPSSAGIMPLEQLVYIPNQASKLKVFLDNSKNLPKSNMSLIYAIEKNDIEVVTQILSIPGIDINYTNSKGESALFVAAKKGDIQKVALLLTFAPIDLETRDETGTTAIQIARDNNHQEVAQLILTQLKNALESKTSSLLRQEHTFVNYALTLHKTPTEDLYIRYLKGLITLNNTQDTTNKVTQLEAHYVMSRKLWSDVVSETYLANLQYSQSYAVKEKVIQRLKEMGVTYPIKTYQDCMAYIREDSVITLSFNAAFLENGLADCQPLNMWQRGEGYRTSSYESIRDNVEKGLFSFLSEDLRTALFDNIEARPRYAACWLPDKNTTRPHASWYGNSFLVLKDVVKLNSIFSPGNAFSYKSRIKQDYKVCTVHNLDLLLLQCHSATLQAIINKVTKGELKADNYDQNVIWEKNKGGHFEAMIPVFHFLNPDFVEHIHIDPNDYVLSAAEKGLIQSRGITVSNSLVPPYEDLSKKFANAKNEHANTLLEKYPLLRKIFTQQKLPTHLAKLKGLLEKLNALAIKNDFRAFNATWNRLEKAGFIKEAKRSVTEYFNIFFGPINFVFEKLIKTKDENITKLFFDSKLMDLDNLLNNFLYPKQGTAENSLFYKYISYGIENKNETFLNVLFNQIPKACQLSFMELFKTDYINCLAKINHFLALKVLIYLKQKNHLSLEQGTITPKSNLLLQAEYAIQILYSLMQDTALSPLETDSLKNCAPELLTNLFQILVRQHPIYEVRNLLNADIFREKMSAQCEEMDQIFYVIYLEKIIFCYQKELEIFALAGTFEKFKEPWEKIFSLYHQDKKQIEKKFPSVLNSIFNQAAKGGNLQIVRLMLMSNLIDINQIYENRGNKSTDEPLGCFTAVSLAVYSNNLPMLKILFENSADLDFYNKLQTVKVSQTPLAIAVSNDNPDIVDFLLEKGITIWNKEESFACSAIRVAITMDFQCDKESAYYFKLLFNKLSASSKTELLEKFKTDYLPWLSYNHENEAKWMLNLLLKKQYLNVEDLLCNITFRNSSIFRPILLEIIINLNKPTGSQIQFLKNNKKSLNKLIKEIDLNLFSLVELEQLTKQSTILTLLDPDIQKKIIETFKINQCKHQPLTLTLVKEIIGFADKQLAQKKKSLLSRERTLQFHIFYQEMKRFITQVSLRFKKKKVTDDTKLDFSEIQTLLVIIEDFQQTIMNQLKESWYSPPLQLAIKQVCNTPSLSVLIKNASESTLQLNRSNLPTLNNIMQKAVEKYKAYISVMCPDIEKAVKQFRSDEASQAIDFILPRVKGTPYRDIDTVNAGLVQKVVNEADVKNYLQKIFTFNEDLSFVLIAEEPYPSEDSFAENFQALSVEEPSNTGERNVANSSPLASGFFKTPCPDDFTLGTTQASKQLKS